MLGAEEFKRVRHVRTHHSSLSDVLAQLVLEAGISGRFCGDIVYCWPQQSHTHLARVAITEVGGPGKVSRHTAVMQRMLAAVLLA